LSGCNNGEPTRQLGHSTGKSKTPDPYPIQETVEPLDIQDTEPGKTTLKGNLSVLNPLMNAPDRDDAIFLVPLIDQSENISTIPKLVKGEVPQAVVDERNGNFVFTNIKIGTYAIVVLTINGQQIPARIMEDGSIAIIEIDKEDAGDIIELDQLSLP